MLSAALSPRKLPLPAEEHWGSWQTRIAIRASGGIKLFLKGESKYLQIDLNEFPNSPESAGTIINCNPRIGIWLMPCNTSPGELEDFAATMIPDDDPIWPSSKQYISNISRQHRKFDNSKTPKAELFAWLATRKNPGRMGAAIGADDLSLDNELCETFLKWLTELFR